MDLFTLSFALIDAVMVAAYFNDSSKEGLYKAAAPVVGSVALFGAVALLLREMGNTIPNETSAFLVLAFSVMFAILPFYYARNNRRLFLFLIATILQFFFVTYVYGSVLYPFIQTLAIGTACGFINRAGLRIFRHPKERANRVVETRRDVMHALLGVAILAIFLGLPFYDAVYATTTAILIGYTYNSLVGDRRGGWSFAFLKSLERPNSLFGLGALYLGVGMALLMGFIHARNFMFVGIAALLIADPVATIVGINMGGPRLPYNKRKSLYGTVAFLVVVAAVGYIFVGWYSVLFGIFLAVVEGIDMPLDDNISIPVFTIIAYAALLAAIGQLAL